MALSLADIKGLFDSFGAVAYSGEPVTQLEHALQSGALAEEEGASEELVAAAFLHDNIVPPDPSVPLLEKQQIVNWDVLGRMVHTQAASAKRMWNKAFGR